MEAAVYRLNARRTIWPTRTMEAIHGRATGDTVEGCQRLTAFVKSVACPLGCFDFACCGEALGSSRS